MPTLGRVKTRETQWHANLTDQNHLGMMLHAKPAKLSTAMDQIFSAQNYYSENPLTSNILGSEETIGSTSWEWEMRAATSKPAVVTENVSGSEPGKYKREFKIKLDVDWFLPSDVITPGNKLYQCRVQSDRVKSGNGYIYTVVLMTENDNLFVPTKYLAGGAKWSKLYSQGSEANYQRGSTVMGSPIAFKNHMGKLTKMYSVTDYASTEVLEAAIVGSDGKYHKTWMMLAEMEYWQQWYKEQESALWYSKSTQTVMDSNGRPVRSFAGIQEQLQDGHTYGYNQLTAKLIEEYLMDIFYSRVKPGSGRKIKGFTGEYGMLQFHKAIQNAAQNNGFLQVVDVSSNFIQKDGSPYHSNAFSYGYQFTKYKMANGTELELVHNPLYDDRDLHTDINPITGKPYESQRITFLDFAGENKKSNIRKIKKKDGYSFGYVEGMVGPTGPQRGGKMAHAGSWYEMHVEDSFGLQIDDVTKTGELIFEGAN